MIERLRRLRRYRPRLPARRTVAGWGRLHRSRMRRLRPADGEAAASLLARTSHGAIARGRGRSYGDAAQLEGGLALESVRLGHVGEVELLPGGDAVIEVGAGVELGALLDHLVPLGWMLPVLPGTGHVTVGGAIAADVHGKNHHHDGSFARYVEAFDLILAGSEQHRLDRDADPSLFQATLGGMGLTGVVTAARLRIVPLASPRLRIRTERHGSIEALIARMTEVDRNAAVARYSVAWLDLSHPRRRGRGLLELAAPDLEHTQAFRASRFRRFTLPVPPLPGRGLARTGLVRALSWLHYRRPRRNGSRPLASYLFPLDRVAGLPRLYGGDGMLQYHVALPEGAVDTLLLVARRLAGGPVTPTLAVLKQFGDQGEGMLSFPLRGWSLAVDLPASDARLYLLLNQLDELVAAAGGRVYLAKDARLGAAAFARMYPRLQEFRAVKQRVDPTSRIRSELAERLEIVPEREPRG